MIYNCCDENRRAAILHHPTLNGIDYLEVLDHDAIPLGSPRQQTLLLHCLKAVPATLTPNNVLIQGGESITITALWIAPASSPLPMATAAETAYFNGLANAANILVVRTSVAGDFSPYTLRLVNDITEAVEDGFTVTEALAGFDPQLAEVEFSFKVECGPDFDCAPPAINCPPALPDPPPINYLAKDYGSFRSIMLDRLNQLLPSWEGSSEADMGVVLAELISYVGDQLSYQQDAIATEAYLLTARSRVSLRRHALLVDYRVHDGCNARSWIHLNVNAQVFMDRAITRFYTYAAGMPSTLAIGAGNEEAALIAGVVVFEPMQDAVLYPEHNQMSFYTWGDANCCLAVGATEATIKGAYPNLQVGDVLIFKEVMGPQTGFAADADIRHRCAVRITRVTTQNGQGQPLVDPLFDSTGAPITSGAQQPTLVTEIQWFMEDALPFPVCLSSKFLDSKGDEVMLADVSIILGNIVLADQGLSMTGVSLGTVPNPTIFRPPNPSGDRCHPTARVPLPMRYRPQIPDRPVTLAVPLQLAGSPVTPNAVPLVSNGDVSLNDANGLACLTVQAADPLSWPQYFGIIAQPNAIDPSRFDLAIVFDPPGGPAGMSGPVVLERFPSLSLTIADPNYAVTQLNSLSRFVRVPSTYAPPGTAPTAFPAAPTMLPNTGSVDLLDNSSVAYLTVKPTNPLSWPPLFSVLAQGNLTDPSLFNLLVLYTPPSGPVGIAVPAVVEQFIDVSLQNVATTFSSGSDLVRVRSFDEEPSPSLSAHALMNYDANQAVPAMTLKGILNGISTDWIPVSDLLADSPTDTNFVVEVESDGVARLRFGDDINGRRPPSGTSFTAFYRIGNGTAGNVGAESLIFLAADPRITACTNPLAASGGVDPETNNQIQRRAPQAFMTQERAVTMADYVTVAEKNSQVEDAAATLRWTGSWYTVFITAEPQGGGNLTPTLQKSLTCMVDRYRLAGQDIQLESPEYISLEIELTICVDPAYFASDVEKSLCQVLGRGMLANGEPALFAPQNFVLGETVYLSRIYAAARSVAGVQSVAATVFRPQGVATSVYLSKGEIPLGPFQVARMDNDPSLPDHGRLTLVMKGGKR
ncbi:MAG TPA: putative baseplate assembly protein [Acidobacteriaceae bacterium]